MVAVLIWQALAWVSPYQVALQSDAIAHAVVHVQEQDHHHHADRSLHLQDDAQEPPHQHADEGAQPPALMPVGASAAMPAPSAVRVAVTQREHRSVDSDGPLRPPQPVRAAG